MMDIFFTAVSLVHTEPLRALESGVYLLECARIPGAACSKVRLIRNSFICYSFLSLNELTSILTAWCKCRSSVAGTGTGMGCDEWGQGCCGPQGCILTRATCQSPVQLRTPQQGKIPPDSSSRCLACGVGNRDDANKAEEMSATQTCITFYTSQLLEPNFLHLKK